MVGGQRVICMPQKAMGPQGSGAELLRGSGGGVLNFKHRYRWNNAILTSDQQILLEILK